jgi:hypothetical protein
MSADRKDPRGRLVPIRAGVIRFDDRGRIIIDKETRDEIGSFKLPPWLGGGGSGPGGGTDMACPVTACGDAACVPESVCGDVACVPEGACADAACVPEGVCGDAACVPESICADAACVPESICADAACVPEAVCADGKCIDIFCSERNKSCETNMTCSPDDGPGGSTGPGQVETL